MKKIVIITYSVQGSDHSVKENIKKLGNWFNYFPGSWLLVTTLAVQDIYNRVGTNKSGDRFLVMEVDLKSYYGILPTEAWDWLKNNKNEQGRW